MHRYCFVILTGLSLAACASTRGAGADDGAPRADWAAYGRLAPDPSREPTLIGFYATRGDCEAALDDWLSSQVVGNPVSGECLPADHD